MTRVQDELAEVVSQSSFVSVKTFLTAIFASMVDCDADGTSELGSKTDSFELCEGESTSESGSVAVANSLASHLGSQFIEGTRGSCSGSSPSSLQSSLFATGLVEPDTNVTLPMFAEVDVGQDVVVLNHDQ